MPAWVPLLNDIPPFPMPDAAAVRLLVDEIRSTPMRSTIGLKAQHLRSKISDWVTEVRSAIRGESVKVTGALKENMKLWNHHLKHVPTELRHKVLQWIESGVPLPWDGGRPPLHPIRTWHNNPDLVSKRDLVWKTLKEQLEEEAVQPWDVQRRGLPMGLSPIKWVSKTGTDKVRIVIVLCSINKKFDERAGHCTLQSLHAIRSMWEQDDWQISADQHNSFFHLENSEEDKTWLGFSLHPDELPLGVAKKIVEKYGDACVHTPTGRLIFVCAGLVQGATHSTATYNTFSSAVVQGFTAFRHGSQTPRITSYIDDYLKLISSPLLADGSRDLYRGFVDALILLKHFVIRMIRLRFTFNVPKSRFLPAQHRVHLGSLCSSPDLRFRNTIDAAAKLRQARDEVRAQVDKSQRVLAKVLAKFLGRLWSKKLLMPRAVAIMTRAMFNTLARKLRLDLSTWVISAKRLLSDMKKILKHSWTGYIIWDQDAEIELQFWESVAFIDLESPMHFDKHDDHIRECVLRPDCSRLHDSVRIFAADTSSHASGVAEFSLNDLKVLRAATIPLTEEEKLFSSTCRELLGILRMDFSIVPNSAKTVIFLCDNLPPSTSSKGHLPL